MVTLASVYAHIRDRMSFYRKLPQTSEIFLKRNVVLVGDHNCVMGPKVDRFNGSITKDRKIKHSTKIDKHSLLTPGDI